MVVVSSVWETNRAYLVTEDAYCLQPIIIIMLQEIWSYLSHYLYRKRAKSTGECITSLCGCCCIYTCFLPMCWILQSIIYFSCFKGDEGQDNTAYSGSQVTVVSLYTLKKPDYMQVMSENQWTIMQNE